MILTRRDTLAAMAAAGAAGLAGTAARAQDAAAPAEVGDFGIGPKDAKVTMIEYGSFTCIHCAAFNTQVFPQLKADYIDTGKIHFIFREVIFVDRQGNPDKPALWAGLVARCGGDMRYFGISDLIYANRDEWLSGTSGNAIIASLRKYGRMAGLDDTTLNACLSDGATAKAVFDRSQANVAADNVQGTPSFVINGTMHSNMSYDEMKKILDAELAK